MQGLDSGYRLSSVHVVVQWDQLGYMQAGKSVEGWRKGAWVILGSLIHCLRFIALMAYKSEASVRLIIRCCTGNFVVSGWRSSRRYHYGCQEVSTTEDVDVAQLWLEEVCHYVHSRLQAFSA